MLRILRKSLANIDGRSSPSHRRDSVEDLTAWVLVSPSLSDDKDLYSDDIISDGEHEDPKKEDVVYMQMLSVSPQPVVCLPVGDDVDVSDDDFAVDEDDGGMDDDDNDVDDELIPWKLKDRFGKQRIRKVGKRGGPNVSKSKRLPHYHNKPGCLYGKHGLGVQHHYI